MRQPPPIEHLPMMFTDYDDFEAWVSANEETFAGMFCFVATVDGWCYLAEWNGNQETRPVTIARHTRGFWQLEQVNPAAESRRAERDS